MSPRTRFERTLSRFPILLATVVLAASAAARADQIIGISDVSPGAATWPTDHGGTGGRVNGMAVHPTNPLIAYAASEWGGIYKTINGGNNWTRLDGHRPNVTWDVEVNPANPNRVYATSWYDGRSPSLSGINVSTDGGVTWTHPATAVPPPGLCANAADQVELTAFGIAIDKGNPSRIYIGTSCGLAVSTDAGDTWSYTAPLGPGTGARIWDVVSAIAGFADTCGDNGHRFLTSGNEWYAGNGLWSGRCSITASPYDGAFPSLIATVGQRIFEAPTGSTWTETRTNRAIQGRVPFVAVNKRSGGTGKFDLWFGDTLLHRVSCDATLVGNKCGQSINCCLEGPPPPPDPPQPGPPASCTDTTCKNAVVAATGYASCATTWTDACARKARAICSCDSPPWVGTLVDWGNGHGDQGDILFNSTASIDACPILNSADAGVVKNSLSTSPACQTPAWVEPVASPHALWPMSLSGALGANGHEHVYVGNQDNGVFGVQDVATSPQSWVSDSCCDVFDTLAVPTGAAEDESVIYSLCCGGGSTARATNYYRSYADFAGQVELDPPHYGLSPGWRYPDAIARWGDKKYAMITNDCTVPGPNDADNGCVSADGGVFITQNIQASPVVWTELGNATEPPMDVWVGGCAIYTAANSATFYVQTGNCNGDTIYDGSYSDKMYKFTGTNPAGSWTQLTLPGNRSFGVFAVDPNNPSRLIASGLTASDATMYISTNGGATWNTLSSGLDVLMRGFGDFPIKNTHGATDFTSMNGYHQPSMVAFDPFDTGNIIAGGRDSGIFLSQDSGATWTPITDPRRDSPTPGAPHIPRPKHAYFSNANHTKSVYVSSQGRGVWRFSMCDSDVYEADDTSATAKPILSGVAQNHSICGTHDSDFEYFTVTENSAVTITTASAAGDPALALRDNLGNLIQFDDNSAANGRDAVIQRTCGAGSRLGPGTYRIEAAESGHDDTILSYTLNLLITPCCGNGALDSGEGCDDGNRVNGDCCSATCVFDTSGTLCNDGEACSTGAACNGAGLCTPGVRRDPPPALGTVNMTSSLMTWSAVPSATSYDVVSGNLDIVRQNGGNYALATTSCVANDQASLQIDHSALLPSAGDALFFLVRGANCAGPGTYNEGSLSQVGGRDVGIEATPGRCPSFCVEARCSEGAPFFGACATDPCISLICGLHPHCCAESWDAVCVASVLLMCNSLTCHSSAPACAHTGCTQGAALVSGCDNPPLNPSCVASICGADPYCCNTAWDGQCVGEVNSICGYNCQ